MEPRVMPRVQQIILPILRADLPGVTVTSWVPDVDFREFPLINVRRVSGAAVDVDLLDMPVVEITAITRDGVAATEDLLLDARTSLYRACRDQTVTEHGYIHSYEETFGPAQFDSRIDDAWRIQTLIRLGIRPARTRVD